MARPARRQQAPNGARPRTALERPSQRLWPGGTYRISTVRLESDLHLARALPDTWPDLLDVGAYIDGLFAMQRSDGTLPLGAHGALREVSTSLQRVALELDRRYSQAAADALAEVAHSLGTWRFGEPMARLTPAQCACMLDSDLIVFCGAEMNWSFRTTVPLLSLSVCVHDRDRTERVQEAFGGLQWLTSLYRQALGLHDLRLRRPPRFVLGHLVLAAGVATTHPTHFARFLPEDLGCPFVDVETTTLAYTNIYAERFSAISAPLFYNAFGRAARVAPHRVDHCLETWFRGHDLAHSCVTDRTAGAPIAKRFPRWAGVLEEALADSLGFLAAEQLELIGAGTRTSTCDTFVAEALRYCRRDSRRFADSSAASLELRELFDGGGLKNDGIGLTMDEDRLSASVSVLARRLGAAVLEGDDSEAASLLERSGHASGVVPGVERVLERCTQVPDDLAYVP